MLLRTPRAKNCGRASSHAGTLGGDRNSEPGFRPGNGCVQKRRWRSAPKRGGIPLDAARPAGLRSVDVQIKAAKHQDRANPPAKLEQLRRELAITCLKHAQSFRARLQHPGKECFPIEASLISRSVPSTACG